MRNVMINLTMTSLLAEVSHDEANFFFCLVVRDLCYQGNYDEPQEGIPSGFTLKRNPSEVNPLMEHFKCFHILPSKRNYIG